MSIYPQAIINMDASDRLGRHSLEMLVESSRSVTTLQDVGLNSYYKDEVGRRNKTTNILCIYIFTKKRLSDVHILILLFKP